MAIKNIICAYSGERSRGSALRHAIKLTQHHDGWLTGVLRHERPALARKFAGQVPQTILDQLREQDEAVIQAATERFQELVDEAGLTDRAQFVRLDHKTDGPISAFARAFDIVVTGVHSTDTQDEHLSAHPDLIALQSGRPVLVVPNGFDAVAPAEHALVAWDGKRSAARALADAMPILVRKAKVTVLSVGGPASGADDLIRNLRHHNVEATYLTQPRRNTIAETVLSTAEELSARLIVMGAFEHSKFAHMIAGGVTTDVMRDARIPVILSH